MGPLRAGRGGPQGRGSPGVILGLHLEKVNTKILRDFNGAAISEWGRDVPFERLLVTEW